MKFAVALIVVLLLIGGGTYWLLDSKNTDTLIEETVVEESTSDLQPKPVVEPLESVPTELAQAEEQKDESKSEPLPSLEESTPWLKEKTETLLESPVFKGFFKQEEPIRKFVAAVDRISRGENPYRHLTYLAPSGSFKTEKKEDKIFIHPDNSRRTLALIEAVELLPVKRVLAVYQKAEPLFVEAYVELGNSDTWADAVNRVFDEIETFEYPETPIEIIGSKSGYIFKDQTLEELSPLKKALIRMGPEHADRLKLLAKSYRRHWK
ncbi:MAG: hypothetical protein CR997_11350 [Acidobacteria bacterium]|nr:MAG: hypothetical protein CR997_11350 [Acidobacteriota bacterium]